MNPLKAAREVIACRCPDAGVGNEAHCALLTDFPGGFYGDMEANDYYGDPWFWCECECHDPRDEEADGYDEGSKCGPDCGYCGRCT